MGIIYLYNIPVIEGKVQWREVRRIDIGGAKAIEMLQKTLQLKYPYLRQKVTSEVAEELFLHHGYCASNFSAQLTHLEGRYEEQMVALKRQAHCIGELPPDPDSKKQIIKVYKDQISYENETEESKHPECKLKLENEVIIQLPYNPVLMPTEEEVKHRQEMRKEQGRRLKEYMQKKREEKKAQLNQE